MHKKIANREKKKEIKLVCLGLKEKTRKNKKKKKKKRVDEKIAKMK